MSTTAWFLFGFVFCQISLVGFLFGLAAMAKDEQ
jgi:hypothetical protein